MNAWFFYAHTQFDESIKFCVSSSTHTLEIDVFMWKIFHVFVWIEFWLPCKNILLQYSNYSPVVWPFVFGCKLNNPFQIRWNLLENLLQLNSNVKIWTHSSNIGYDGLCWIYTKNPFYWTISVINKKLQRNDRKYEEIIWNKWGDILIITASVQYIMLVAMPSLHHIVSISHSDSEMLINLATWMVCLLTFSLAWNHWSQRHKE